MFLNGLADRKRKGVSVTFRCERPPVCSTKVGFAEIFLMPQPPILTRRRICLGRKQGPLRSSPNTDERPVKRDDQEQKQRINNAHEKAEAENIFRPEISVTVTDHQNTRLVDKYLSARRKNPQHSDLEGAQSVLNREFH